MHTKSVIKVRKKYVTKRHILDVDYPPGFLGVLRFCVFRAQKFLIMEL